MEPISIILITTAIIFLLKKKKPITVVPMVTDTTTTQMVNDLSWIPNTASGDQAFYENEYMSESGSYTGNTGSGATHGTQGVKIEPLK